MVVASFLIGTIVGFWIGVSIIVGNFLLKSDESFQEYFEGLKESREKIKHLKEDYNERD